MDKTLKEMVEDRASLVTEIKKMQELWATEKRVPTPEEDERWDKVNVDFDELTKSIDIANRMEEVNRKMRIKVGGEPDGNGHNGDGADDLNRDGEITRETRANAMRAWFLHGKPGNRPEFKRDAERLGLDTSCRELTIRMNPDAPRTRETIQEQRAQSVGTTSAGGFTVPDEAMAAIELALLEFGGMRRANTTILRTSTGADLPIPKADDTSNVGAILAENTAVAEQDVTFAQTVLQSFKYSSKLIKVSAELLQDSAVNVPSLIGGMLGERIGRITNTHFTTGTGSGQPNGVVTAATLGVTGATGQTTTVIYDNIVDLFHKVDVAYRDRGAVWMMNDNTVGSIKKIVDTQGRPLWLPNLVPGAPDTLLGRPIVVNNDVAVMAANANSILFGDFSKYWIRDVLDIVLLRLDERFADLHQVGFLAFSRHDGDLIDAGTNPVKYYKNSAT